MLRHYEDLFHRNLLKNAGARGYEKHDNQTDSKNSALQQAHFLAAKMDGFETKVPTGSRKSVIEVEGRKGPR